MDMLLAATVTCAVGSMGLRLLGLAGPRAVPAAWLFMALATLAKGPLGLVLPGLIVAGFIVATRQWTLARTALSPLGIALFLLVAGPWYGLMWRHQGQAFVDVFLLNHNLQRFTSTIHRHPGPILYYVPVLLAGVFPWSGPAVAGFGTLKPRVSRVDVFVLFWLALPFVFFSAAGSKLPGYILPCLPPLALVAGRALHEMGRGQLRGALGMGARGAAMVTLLLACVLAAVPLYLRSIGEPDWRLAIPFSMWCLLVGLGLRLRAPRDPAGALGLLRVGAAGMLVLLAWAAPPILARRESGRALFARTAGHEVLVWGAWRTAWMAGYFYNDGQVREIAGEPEITSAAAAGPVFVLAGPGERRRLEATPGLVVTAAAEGPRSTTLLVVRLSKGR
jgi:4-amino-4-deoxy-L-arabinose transferase-like glycosyltransferase